jgi:CBS-domain-containing membrane protein
MENKKNSCCSLSDSDLRAALVEMKTYVDVTEEDLKKIFAIALRYAQARRASQVSVREVMTGSVVTISSAADINEAARLMSEHKISGMPVVDEKNQVIGVISQADILVSAGMYKGHTFSDILRNILGAPMPAQKVGGKVKDAMSTPAVTCKADDDLGDAARILDERRIKRLPVVDGEGTLIGILSRADIVRAIGKK